MKPLRKFVKPGLKVIILLLVVWGIYHSVQKSRVELGEQRQLLEKRAERLESSAASATPSEAAKLNQRASDIRQQAKDFWKPTPSGLLLAGGWYALGMLPASLYWYRCLRACGQHAPLWAVLWAYFYGNLGKYVPGKALVLILRVGSLLPFGVQKLSTTLTIFLETLTMMAVGGAVAAISLMILQIDWRLTALAVGLLAVTFPPTTPYLLPRLIRLLRKDGHDQALVSWFDNLSWRLTIEGWALLSLTWLAFGLSLLAVLNSLPSTELFYSEAITGGLALYLSVLGATALAVVLGFVSLIPGGAGVREVVLSMILTPVVGPIAALCCALWLRLVWLGTELGMVGLLGGIRYWNSAKVDDLSSDPSQSARHAAGVSTSLADVSAKSE